MYFTLFNFGFNLHLLIPNLRLLSFLFSLAFLPRVFATEREREREREILLQRDYFREYGAMGMDLI